MTDEVTSGGETDKSNLTRRSAIVSGVVAAISGCVTRLRGGDADPRPVTERYADAVPPTGPTGGKIEVNGAELENNTLRISAKMPSGSLFPLNEALSALEDPLFADYEAWSEFDVLVRSCTDCDGNWLASETTRKEWIADFRNVKGYTLGDIQERREETFLGIEELDAPNKLSGEDAVSAEELTCEDWYAANPEVLGNQ